MNKILIILFLLTSFASAKAQSVERLWNKKFDGFSTSLVYEKSRLYFTTSITARPHAYALDAKNGKIKWTKPGFYSGMAPVLDKEAIYLSHGDQLVLYGTEILAMGKTRAAAMIKLDRNTGRQIWKFNAFINKPGKDVSSTITHEPTYDQEALYFGMLEMHTQYKGMPRPRYISRFYAVDKQTGKKLWHFTVSEMGKVLYKMEAYAAHMALFSSSGNDFGNEINTATLANGLLYIGGMNGILYCLNAKTGKLKWKFRTRFPSINNPVVYDNKVYIGSRDWTLYTLDANSGKEIWRWSAGFDLSFQKPFIYNEGIYFASGLGGYFTSNQFGEEDGVGGEVGGFRFHTGAIYGVDAKNGKELWARKTKTIQYGTSRYRDFIYSTNAHGQISFHDARSGRQTTLLPTKVLMQSLPLITGSKIFASTLILAEKNKKKYMSEISALEFEL